MGALLRCPQWSRLGHVSHGLQGPRHVEHYLLPRRMCEPGAGIGRGARFSDRRRGCLHWCWAAGSLRRILVCQNVRKMVSGILRKISSLKTKPLYREVIWTFSLQSDCFWRLYINPCAIIVSHVIAKLWIVWWHVWGFVIAESWQHGEVANECGRLATWRNG